MDNETLECLEQGPDCQGEVQMETLNGYNYFPRCRHHWDKRLELARKHEEQERRRQPRYCVHGTYLGYPGGPDYMCGRCEMGED